MRWTARLMFVAMSTATACSLATSFEGLTDGDESSSSGSPDGSSSPTDGVSGDGASADGASTSSSGGPADEGGADAADDASADAASDAGTDPAPDAGADAAPDAGTNMPSDAGTDGRVPYPTTVLSDNPEAYWRLSEASGPTFADSSGHGHTATLNGSASYSRPGALAHDDDGALQLSGSLTIGDVFDFPGTVPFTFEAWVKPRLTTSGLMPIYVKMATPRPKPGTYLFIDQSVETLGFERWVSGGASCSVKVKTTLPTTTFTHVVVTFDSEKVILYVDGVDRASGGHGSGVEDNAAIAAWGGFFDGTLDELAIYSKALSAARVKAHYDAATK